MIFFKNETVSLATMNMHCIRESNTIHKTKYAFLMNLKFETAIKQREKY